MKLKREMEIKKYNHFKDFQIGCREFSTPIFENEGGFQKARED